MGVDSKHPLYSEKYPDWLQLRDCYRGERAIKERGRVYLPATSGMILDGADKGVEQKGWKAYSAYRTRAVFPELVKAAVEAMIGVMHHKPPVIELPAVMEPLREQATLHHESLEMFLRRINEEQLVTGRAGLIADLAVGQDGLAARPYLAKYRAEDIINWDEGTRDVTKLDSLNLVVLNESEPERTAGSFDWQDVTKHRVLTLGKLDANEPSGAGAVYKVGTFREAEAFSEERLIAPSLAGKTLDRIPFVFVNSKDIVPTPDEAPLLGLSYIALTIYRGEADYRQALFMQGQDTLVIIGGEEEREYRTGAGATITPPIGADAKFIGVNSAGLPSMQAALENDYQRGNRKSGELLDETSREKESGEALTVRVAAKTATLNQIALAGAAALQEILRIVAGWMGANPEQVVVIPNLDFVDDQMTGDELVQLMSAKTLGAPLSLETIHGTMQDRGMTKKTFDEEVEAIEAEKELELVPPPATDEDGPAADKGQPGAGSAS